MTRFKELQRIETAIKHRNRPELEWALSSCKMRLGIASHKEHRKHRQKIEDQIKAALVEVPSAANSI